MILPFFVATISVPAYIYPGAALIKLGAPKILISHAWPPIPSLQKKLD
jgi:hypothetical protein